jgi:hypothetical protein
VITAMSWPVPQRDIGALLRIVVAAEAQLARGRPSTSTSTKFHTSLVQAYLGACAYVGAAGYATVNQTRGLIV